MSQFWTVLSLCAGRPWIDAFWAVNPIAGTEEGLDIERNEDVGDLVKESESVARN
jgi:hypothetical protein